MQFTDSGVFAPDLKWLESISQNQIEDELVNSEKEEAFVTASMMFLQIHLIEKLKQDYSSLDLLILEKCSKHKSKRYFIKLKNIECYNEILKKEASIPLKALSMSNMLPNPKWQPKKANSSIFKFFKSITNSIERRRSLTFFQVFKKSKSNLVEPCQLYGDNLPTLVSLTSTQLSTILKEHNFSDTILKTQSVECKAKISFSEKFTSKSNFVLKENFNRHKTVELTRQQSKLSVFNEDDCNSEDEW